MLDIDFMSRLSFAGMVTKNQGAGPFQNKILPINSISICLVYQMPNCVRSAGVMLHLLKGLQLFGEKIALVTDGEIS